MKCGCVIRWDDRRKKGSGAPIRVPRVLCIPKPTDEAWREAYPFRFENYDKALAEPGAEVCTGRVVCSIEAVNEPYYGGTFGVLEVTWKCEVCANEAYAGVLSTDPDVIAKMVTDVVVAMPAPGAQPSPADRPMVSYRHKDAKKTGTQTRFRQFKDTPPLPSWADDVRDEEPS